MKLTGEIRFRKHWTGKVVLQVQFFYLTGARGHIGSHLEWRDAYLEDLKRLPDMVEVNRSV